MAWLPTPARARARMIWSSTRAWPTRRTRWARLLAGCRTVACDDLTELGDARPALVWLNSPANPTGADPRRRDAGRAGCAWARERGALVAADECYGEFGWEAEPVSVLHPSVSGGDHERPAGRALAVQALQPGRLPGRVRRRRSRSGGRAARGPQARRDDGAPAGAAGDDRAAGRPGSRRASSGSATWRAGRCCGRRWRRRASGSSTRKGRSTCGRPATRTAGPRSTSWPDSGILVAPGDFYGPAAAPARPRRPDRDRRADRGRRLPTRISCGSLRTRRFGNRRSAHGVRDVSGG